MWMRTDFREERRWKIALAFDLSTAVLEWHKAGTRARRLEEGIIVDWSKPQHIIDEEALNQDGDVEMRDSKPPPLPPRKTRDVDDSVMMFGMLRICQSSSCISDTL